MGLKTTQTNMTFLSIAKGKMIMRVKEPTTTSVPRLITKGKNEGTTVHEELFDTLDGKIISVEKSVKKVSFQNDPYVTLEIIVKDSDGDVFSLSMPYSSGYTKGILTRIESVDFDKEVEIKTYWIKGDDQKERGFAGIIQHGEKIEPLYSKGDGIMPPVEVVKVGSKDVYNDEQLLAFYDDIISKLPKGSVSVETSEPETEPEQEEHHVESHVDDAELTSGPKKF